METILKEILDKAVYAPSGDNSQPWWFRVSSDTITVYLVPSRDNPILNFRLSGSYLAHGCLIRNIEILATTHGLATATTLLPDKNDDNLVAHIRFHKDPTVLPSPLAAFITERHTNRKAYSSKPVPKEFGNQLITLQDRVSGVHVAFIDKKEAIHTVASALVTMERTALETEAVHKLFFETILWTRAEEVNAEKGLYIKTLELPPPIQGLFHLIRHWKVTQTLNKIGLSRLAAKGNQETYAKSPLMGVIAIQDFSIIGYIRSGMVFQEIWLSATKEGLSLQPVAGLLFLAQRILHNEECPWSDAFSQRIIESYERIRSTFGIQGSVCTMLFRMGYANDPTARSTKRPPVIEALEPISK